MIFRVELEDFYLESETELKPALKDAIVYDIVAKIRDQIKPIVEKTISDLVKSKLDETILTLTNSVSQEFIETGKVPVRYGESVSYKEYMEKRTIELWPENKVKDLCEKIVKEHSSKVSEEMKSRYDIMFAAGVVKKMQEFGLMSTEIAQRLVNTTSTEGLK